MGRYDYEELREKAIKSDATQEDINALGEWFEQYDMDDWNGEYFNADGYCVRPVYSDPDEDGNCEFIKYEIC